MCTLSVTRGRLTLSTVEYFNSVCYLWEVGGFLHGVCELCQLLNAGWWLSVVGCVYSVSLLRQGLRTLSIIYGALAVVCRWVCNLSVT